MKNFDSNGRMTKERVMEVVEHCEKKIASLDFQTKWTSSPGPYDDGALDGQISAYQDVLDMLDLAEEEIKAKLKSDDVPEVTLKDSYAEVKLTFLPTEHGGRGCPPMSGYRPQFYYNGCDWDAKHEYHEPVELGKEIKANLYFLYPEHHFDKLYEGMVFLIREGHKTVAYGSVIGYFIIHDGKKYKVSA